MLECFIEINKMRRIYRIGEEGRRAWRDNYVFCVWTRVGAVFPADCSAVDCVPPNCPHPSGTGDGPRVIPGFVHPL